MVPVISNGTHGSFTRRTRDTVETSPNPDPLPADEIGEPRQVRETVARLNRREKGDRATKDQSTRTETDGALIAADAAAAARKMIAKELTESARRVVGNHGTIKLAASLQLLRRALSKCHDVLRDRKSESDYLSIVVLAERAISQEKWQGLSKGTLHQIQLALAIGETNDRVTYDDFNRVFRLLDATSSLSGPVLDFDATTDSDG